VEVRLRIKLIGVVIPTSEVRARRRHPFTLPERLEQTIFVEIKVALVILIKLHAQRAVKKLDARVAEHRKRRRDRCRGFTPRPSGKSAQRKQPGGGSCRRTEELSSGLSLHGVISSACLRDVIPHRLKHAPGSPPGVVF